MLWTTIISAFAPALVEGVKQVITRLTGGVRATTVAEQIQLENVEIDRMKALAALDAVVGTPSQWVIDLRASTRYIGALLVIAGGLATLFLPQLGPVVQGVAMEAASCCFGFLFGHRLMVNFKGK